MMCCCVFRIPGCSCGTQAPSDGRTPPGTPDGCARAGKIGGCGCGCGYGRTRAATWPAQPAPSNLRHGASVRDAGARMMLCVRGLFSKWDKMRDAGFRA